MDDVVEQVPGPLETLGDETLNDGGLCSGCFSIAVWISSALLIAYLTVIGVHWQAKTKRGNALLFHGRFIIYYAIISAVSIIYVPIYALRPKNVSNTLLLCPASRLAAFVLGVKWELRGGEILDELAGRKGERSEPKGAVLIANHQSTLDSMGMMYFWNKFHPMAAVIKKEVFYAWPFGLAAYLAGSIYIDRSRGKNAINSIESAAHRAEKDKIKMFIFPEGTRNRANLRWEEDSSGKGILPFKSGAFRAAVSTGVPLVPVIFSPYVFIDEKRRLFGQGKAVMKILPEITTTGLVEDDIPELMKKSQKIIQEGYESLRKEVLSTIPPDHLVISKKFY